MIKSDQKLDHPCKQTCSGWKQGYERGFDSRQAQVDELRAENENLEKRFNVGFKNFCELRKERDQLRAEVERLRDLNQDSCERWDAETRELRADNRVHFLKINELQQERDLLKAEVKRLEEALGDAGITHVAPEHLSDDYQEGYCDAMEDIRAWAQIILKDEK